MTELRISAAARIAVEAVVKHLEPSEEIDQFSRALMLCLQKKFQKGEPVFLCRDVRGLLMRTARECNIDPESFPRHISISASRGSVLSQAFPQGDYAEIYREGTN